MVRTEHMLYSQIATYLQVHYPNVIWRFDIAADMKLTKGQAVKHKHLNPHRGYPDLFIAEPKQGSNGLYIEIKVEATRMKKKDGTWASDHLAEQNEMLNKLQAKGYAAYFARGYNEVKDIIDEYLGGTNGEVEF